MNENPQRTFVFYLESGDIVRMVGDRKTQNETHYEVWSNDLPKGSVRITDTLYCGEHEA